LDSNHSWKIKEWFPDLDERALERLQIYHSELVRWTQKINLISPSTVQAADKVHFADSIIASRIVSKLEPDGLIWDLGSGNGLPGAVLSILNPTRPVLLVEADSRKCAFLTQLSIRLDLPELAVRNQRVEDQNEGSIDLAICRGFAPLPTALLLTHKVCAPGARFYHMKGPDWPNELAAVPPQICSTWNISPVETYSLPETTGPGTRVILKSVRT